MDDKTHLESKERILLVLTWNYGIVTIFGKNNRRLMMKIPDETLDKILDVVKPREGIHGCGNNELSGEIDEA